MSDNPKLRSEVDALLSAIAALERVAALIIAPDGTVRERTYGTGNYIDFARKLHAEVNVYLDDVEKAAV